MFIVIMAGQDRTSVKGDIRETTNRKASLVFMQLLFNAERLIMEDESKYVVFRMAVLPARFIDKDTDFAQCPLLNIKNAGGRPPATWRKHQAMSPISFYHASHALV